VKSHKKREIQKNLMKWFWRFFNRQKCGKITFKNSQILNTWFSAVVFFRDVFFSQSGNHP
jgi:hypothetical protein